MRVSLESLALAATRPPRKLGQPTQAPPDAPTAAAATSRAAFLASGLTHAAALLPAYDVPAGLAATASGARVTRVGAVRAIALFGGVVGGVVVRGVRPGTATASAKACPGQDACLEASRTRYARELIDVCRLKPHYALLSPFNIFFYELGCWNGAREDYRERDHDCRKCCEPACDGLPTRPPAPPRDIPPPPPPGGCPPGLIKCNHSCCPAGYICTIAGCAPPKATSDDCANCKKVRGKCCFASGGVLCACANPQISCKSYGC